MDTSLAPCLTGCVTAGSSGNDSVLRPVCDAVNAAIERAAAGEAWQGKLAMDLRTYIPDLLNQSNAEGCRWEPGDVNSFLEKNHWDWESSEFKCTPDLNTIQVDLQRFQAFRKWVSSSDSDDTDSSPRLSPCPRPNASEATLQALGAEAAELQALQAEEAELHLRLAQIHARQIRLMARDGPQYRTSDGCLLRLDESAEWDRGCFKKVTTGYLEVPGGERKRCAVAVMSKYGRSPREQMDNEVDILKHCSHRNIIQFYKYFHEGCANPAIAMELVDPLGCDLLKVFQHYFSQGTRMPVVELVRYYIQIVDALEYLHSKEILHRDVKEDNILIAFPTGRADVGIVKMIDFGQAITFDQLKLGPAGANYWPANAGQKQAAPELRKRQEYHDTPTPVDVWSLGYTLLRFYGGYVSEASVNMMEACEGLMQESSSERWTLERLRKCKWLQLAHKSVSAASPTGASLGGSRCFQLAQQDQYQLFSDRTRDEIQSCKPFGEIMKFGEGYRAFSMTIPSGFQECSLRDMRLDGHNWNVMFVKRSGGEMFEEAFANTMISANDQIIFGTKEVKSVEDLFSNRDHDCRTCTLVANQHKNILRVGNFVLEIDCFEFSREFVGNGKVLGDRPPDAALNFRTIYHLNLVGIGIPLKEGGFQIEWVPPPDFEVKSGYLGLVARIPLVSGRTCRAPGFKNWQERRRVEATQILATPINDTEVGCHQNEKHTGVVRYCMSMLPVPLLTSFVVLLATRARRPNAQTFLLRRLVSAWVIISFLRCVLRLPRQLGDK